MTKKKFTKFVQKLGGQTNYSGNSNTMYVSYLDEAGLANLFFNLEKTSFKIEIQ